MQSNMKILVTGAGGYIGGWICERFFLNGFKNIRAGIRSWSSAARIGRFPIEIVLCDVTDPVQIESAINGMDAVIHCAIGSKEVNVNGTKNLLEAALKHRIKKFIHFSTVDIYGDMEGEITESAPLSYSGRVYGDTKIDAEKICWEYGKKGIPIVVLRPSIVYGPYTKLWISKFAERIYSGKWGIFSENGEGICNLVYIEDVIRAVLLSLESDKAVGEAFNINGAELITWNEYFRQLNKALGLPALREIHPTKSKLRTSLITPIKSGARRLLTNHKATITKLYQRSEFIRTMMKRAEQTMATIPSKEELNLFAKKPIYVISKAKKVLGYEPKFNADTGIKLSTMWLHHENLFPFTNRD